MPATTLDGVLLYGVAASRPAASAVAKGTLYSATDTGVVSQSDGVSTWSTFLSVSATGIPATIVDAKGDVIAATAADTVARLAVGTNGHVLMAASGETTGLKWAQPGLGALIGCKAYKTTQTVTDAVLALDTEYWDNGGFHDNVTNNSRFTIPAGLGGYYLVQASCFTGTTSATRLEIHVNGTAVPGRGSNGAPTGNYVSCLSVISVVATDYIQIKGSSGVSTQYGDSGVAGDYLVASVTMIGV